MQVNSKIAPCLWFEGQAEEAAEFYVSLFPDSQVRDVVTCELDWPGGKKGDVITVDFVLAGQAYQALNGGPIEAFNERVSLSVRCQDQAEVDRYWEGFTKDGGEPIMCGWLKDKFGVRWQIVPEAFFEMVKGDDGEASNRVMEAMMQMVKLDIAKLRQAYEGKA